MATTPEGSSTPPSSRRTDRNKNKKPKKALIITGASVAAVLIAGAFIVPPLFESHDTVVAEAPVTQVVVTPTPGRTYAPVSNFYQQIGPPAGSPLEAVPAQTITVGADKSGRKLSASQVGLSFEATDLANTDLSPDNASVVATFKGLGQPVLRFGGNAVDRRFFWTSTGEAMPAGYAGTKASPAATVVPADLERVKALLDKTNSFITLPVDLGHYDPARAADLAKYGAQIFGKRLLAITIGNEPNGFGKGDMRDGEYTVEQFSQEAKAYADAMYKTAPNVPISGPGTYAANWADAWAKMDIKQKKILTFHNYPLTGCQTNAAADQPTMANLLSKETHDRSINYHQTFVKKGEADGMPVWVDETGISACTGSNETTKTHASALWSVDYSLGSAQQGVSQLDFHSSMITCKGGPPMSAVCFEGAYLQPNGTMSSRANYYGLAMVGSLGAGDFLKMTNDGGGLAYAYAVQQADGSTSVIMVNENNPETAAQTKVTLKLPNIPATATMTQMTGASYGSEDTTLIDGRDDAPVANDKRPAPMGFKPGKQTQSFSLTAGTVTIMNFKY